MKRKYLFKKDETNIWDSFLSFSSKPLVLSSTEQVSELKGTSELWLFLPGYSTLEHLS
jgi:hypothetical protein